MTEPMLKQINIIYNNHCRKIPSLGYEPNLLLMPYELMSKFIDELSDSIPKDSKHGLNWTVANGVNYNGHDLHYRGMEVIEYSGKRMRVLYEVKN